MIKNFRDKETQAIFNREISRKLPYSIQRVAMRKLWMLDAASELCDLRVPQGNHLEVLFGDRKGQQSIRINEKWRLCFIWRHGDAYDVEITDYH